MFSLPCRSVSCAPAESRIVLSRMTFDPTFVLTHASGKTQVHAGAKGIRFAHNVFECTGDGAYLTIAGDNTTVDHNEFRNKKTLGNMIDVRGAGSQIAQSVRIDHNYFHD